MKPFNLEEAIVGKAICTRNGEKVKFVAYVKEATDCRNVVALVGGQILTYLADGRYTLELYCESDLDLFMAPVMREGWVPMAELKGEVVLRHHRVFNSKEDAYESHQTKTPYDKIFTGKITWEE